MRPDIRATLFDVDDTLFDREAAQSIVLKQIVTNLPGLFRNLEMERVEAAFFESDRITTREFDAGAPSDGLRNARSRLFLDLLDIPEEHAEKITVLYVRDYPKVNAPVPGAVKLLDELSRKVKIGVVSNGLPDVQYRKLDTLGLRHRFNCIILSEEIGIRKPDPRIFLLAAAKIGIQPQECLYIGDSYARDIVGAGQAGMMTCWFDRKQAAREKTGVSADLIINRLEELREFFKI
jgi:putative hydrolase of the HAD superfamily